jgi:hypothetical protein
MKIIGMKIGNRPFPPRAASGRRVGERLALNLGDV